MIIRNSITSILRTKKKTALFFLLIFLLSIFMGMGVSVWVANQVMMAECEENYKTIGVFYYMGAGYPDETVLTENGLNNLLGMEELLVGQQKEQTGNALSMLDYTPSRRCLGWVEGYQPRNHTAPYEDEAIYIVKNVYETSVFKSEGSGFHDYMAEITQKIYSYGKERKMLVHFSVEGEGFNPDYDKQYLLHGKWYGDVFSVFELEEVENLDFLQEQGNFYTEKAQFYAGANRLISIELVNQPEYMKVFHQGQAKLCDGDFYEAKENDKVCLVTSDISSTLELEVGDELPLSLVPVKLGNIYDSYSTDESYPESEYEITGIIENTMEYKNMVFIPQQEEITGTFGYSAGQVLLENGSGDAFLESVKNGLPDRMVVDIYDQGYTQVMDAMESLQQTTLIILVICAAAALAVLILFGYLFVFKQRETVMIMKNLGTEIPKIYTYLIVSCGALAATASLVGAVVGYLSSSYFLGKVVKFLNAGIGNGIDNRYSYLAEGLLKDYGQNMGVAVRYFLLTALCLTLAAVIICLIFAARSIRPPKIKKKKKVYAPKRERKSSACNGVIFRFACLSIRRGGMRTWLVCLVSGVLMLVFCVLAYTGSTYEQEKQSVTEKAELEGYFTNRTGKRINNLNINYDNLQKLEASGYIENVKKTLYREEFHYYYLGVSVLADGTAQETAVLEIPDKEEQKYSYEKFVHQHILQPCILYCNDISATGEFFYSSHPKLTWMEGYDETIFAQEYTNPEESSICVISDTMQQEYGIEMGDTIRTAFPLGFLTSYELDFKVVGIYKNEGGNNHILVPLAANAMAWGLESERKWGLDTVRFTLKDAGQVSEFKDYLQETGFSQLKERKNIGSVIILKDTEYQKTIQQLDGKIKYMNLLYPVLYVLTGFISFLVSYLMMHNRKGELALMQSMGTPRWKVFFAFFLEQAILSMAGIVVVWLIWGAATGFTQTQIFCMLICICCYLAGCGLSIGILNRNRVLELLRDKE